MRKVECYAFGLTFSGWNGFPFAVQQTNGGYLKEKTF